MARTLISGGQAVSVDRDIGALPIGDVLIDNDRIVDVGVSIDAGDMIVMPGLVNAHLHTWQTAIRGISADWSLSQHFARMHRGMAASFTPDDIYLGTLVGALNQLNGGVTTLFDWLHNNPTPDHTDGGVDGLIESSIRALFGHGSPKHEPKEGRPHFSEVPHPRAEIERLRTSRLAADDGCVTLAMAILGPYFSTYEVNRQDMLLAAEFDLVASAHIDAGFHRMVPDGITRMHGDGLIDARFNVVHGSDLSDEEISILVDCGASFSITAEAEMQFGFGYPITGRVIAAGGAPSIGSDTEAGMAGDMFSAMRLNLQMQRAVDASPAVTMDKPVEAQSRTAHQALEWATINGARALRMDHLIGSLSAGKKADIILLRADDLNLFPVHDPVHAIVLHANSGNVDTVMVDGEIVKRAGRLLYAGIADKKTGPRRVGPPPRRRGGA